MTFEEWLGDRIETMSSHEYAAEKAAWDAGYHQGMLHSQERILDLQNYIAIGMSADARDVANAQQLMQEFDICLECRSVYGQHRMDCGRQR